MPGEPHHEDCRRHGQLSLIRPSGPRRGLRRDFSVSRGDGSMVVSAVPQTSVWSFHPNDYVVGQAEPVFGLAEFLAVMQIWRLVKKNECAAVTGAAGAAWGDRLVSPRARQFCRGGCFWS